MAARRRRRPGRKTWRTRRPEPVDPISAEVVAATAEDREARLDLARALTRLTDRQRLAVELHHVLGIPVAEVASVLGCAEGTVKSTLSDARKRLRAPRWGRSTDEHRDRHHR